MATAVAKPPFTMLDFNGFSMFPFIRPGDRLVVGQPGGNRFHIGDVVVFRRKTDKNQENATAHRIIKITDRNELVTKGDNLPLPDPETLHPAEIQGRVVMVVRNSRILSLKSGIYGVAGKWIAYCSAANLTPGLIMTRLKPAGRSC